MHFVSLCWQSVIVAVRVMDEVTQRFVSQFSLTEAEDCKVVVEESSHLHISDFLLVGKVMTHKDYNKEAYMASMIDLWTGALKYASQFNPSVVIVLSLSSHLRMMAIASWMGARGTSKKCLCF